MGTNTCKYNMWTEWTEDMGTVTVTQNYQFKALNINKYTFKAKAAWVLMLFIRCINECVSDDMAWMWTTVQTVLYTQWQCNVPAIFEFTFYPDHSQLQRAGEGWEPLQEIQCFQPCTVNIWWNATWWPLICANEKPLRCSDVQSTDR